MLNLLFGWFFKDRRKEYIILTDYGTSALLAIGNDWQVMGFLYEVTMDSVFVFYTPKNWFEKRLLDGLVKSEEIYQFGFDRKKNRLIKLDRVSDEIVKKSKLARQKYVLLSDIIYFIQRQRQLTRRTMAFQETIYTSKKIEAQRFKDKNYPEGEILAYPYILEYSEYRNISYKQACEAILTKAMLGDADLAKTDILRIKYFNMIRNSKTKEELDQIDKDLTLDIQILM